MSKAGLTIINQVRFFHREGKLKKALEGLVTLTTGKPDLYDDVCLLGSRLSIIEEYEGKGVMKQSEAITEKIRISESILKIINAIMPDITVEEISVKTERRIAIGFSLQLGKKLYSINIKAETILFLLFLFTLNNLCNPYKSYHNVNDSNFIGQAHNLLPNLPDRGSYKTLVASETKELIVEKGNKKTNKLNQVIYKKELRDNLNINGIKEKKLELINSSQKLSEDSLIGYSIITLDESPNNYDILFEKVDNKKEDFQKLNNCLSWVVSNTESVNIESIFSIYKPTTYSEKEYSYYCSFLSNNSYINASSIRPNLDFNKITSLKNDNTIINPLFYKYLDKNKFSIEDNNLFYKKLNTFMKDSSIYKKLNTFNRRFKANIDEFHKYKNIDLLCNKPLYLYLPKEKQKRFFIIDIGRSSNDKDKQSVKIWLCAEN